MTWDEHRRRAGRAVWLVAAFAFFGLKPALAGDPSGAALLAGPPPAIVAWGDGVTRWPLDGSPQSRFLQDRRFTSGCASQDGTLYLVESGQLSSYRPPYKSGILLEKDTDFQDCLPWSMDGHPGVLIPHRHLQLRFYREGAPPVDLYSIYTPSKQGGLLEADIDRDGRPDLLWGNYWLRRPNQPGAHWRLFAINTFFEQPESALARIAWDGPDSLYWGAAAGTPRLVRLTPGPDRTQLWRIEQLKDAPPGIKALVITEDGLAVAHSAGVDLYSQRGGAFVKTLLDSKPATALFRLGREVWAVFDDGPRRVYRLR